MFSATVDTTWLTGWETVFRVNHSSPHGSSKSRLHKSRVACSGNAHNNGFRSTLRPTLSGSAEIILWADVRAKPRARPYRNGPKDAPQRPGGVRPDISWSIIATACREPHQAGKHRTT